MKIIKTVEPIRIWDHLQNEECVYVLEQDGCASLYDGKTIKLQTYLSQLHYDQVFYVGEELVQLVKKTSNPISLKEIEAGNVGAFKFGTESQCQISNEMALIGAKSYRGKGPIVSTYLRNFPTRRKEATVICNMTTGEYNYSERAGIYHCLDGSCIYGFDEETNQFFKFCFENSEQWYFEQPLEEAKGKHLFQPPVVHGDDIIVSFVPNTEYATAQQRAISIVYSLSKDTGEIKWQITSAHNDLVFAINEGLLYLSMNDAIHIYSADSGTFIKKFNIDKQGSKSMSLVFDEKLIYCVDIGTRYLHLFDLKTHKPQKILELPKGYMFRKSQVFKNRPFRKHYFSLLNTTQFSATFPVLELDPNNLDADVEFEPEPPMTIELNPVNDQKHELVITMTTPSLDDALRFGEIHTRDEAQRHSHNYMGMTFNGREPTPTFNGIIRFVYSGSDQSKDVVNEHLKMMEKRFTKWIEKEGFYSCTDKEQLTTLVAEYR